MRGTKVKIAAVLLLALGVVSLPDQRAQAAAPMVAPQVAPNIREQQAVKDFKMGEFYRRVGHPRSACFYYDLVCRRYPGTRAAKQAGQRLRETILAEAVVIFGDPVEAITSASYTQLFSHVLDILCSEYDIVYASLYDGRIEVREREQ